MAERVIGARPAVPTAPGDAASPVRVLHVTNMWPDPEQPHFGAFVEAQVQSLTRRGVDCRVVYARRDYLGLRRKTREALHATPADVVHAHFGYSAVMIADLCRRARVPLVVSYCGGDLNGEEGPVRRRLQSWVGSVASRGVAFAAPGIVVKSERMLERLPAAARRRAHVIPNGVDLARFTPRGRDAARATLGWDDDRVVLFAGRWRDPTKNFALAQAAVDALNARGTRARLVPLEGVSHAEVPLWLNAADVVLLTSLREGSPNIVKEALACDARVVSVDVGDVAWLLDGVSNARVCAYEAGALAEGIMQVLDQERRGGRSRIERLGLDERSIAARLEHLYRELRSRTSR
jgi:glycosyltransferase involved in cell wall biosynthesis